MLASSKMIGFVMTADSKRARRFYEETLGFKFVKEDQFALVMMTEENMIRISPVKEFTPAGHTVLGWQVKEIEREAQDLKERGVVFENFPWMKHSGLGIWDSPSG